MRIEKLIIMNIIYYFNPLTTGPDYIFIFVIFS